MRRAPNYIPELGREGVQRACLDLLEVHHIRHYRMNAGDTIMIGEGGKRWRKKGHAAGTPDILMHVPRPKVKIEPIPSIIGGLPTGVGLQFTRTNEPDNPLVVWVECKSTDGDQRPEQKEFQQAAEANGETYLLIRDPQELIDWLKEHEVIR